MKIAIVSDIHSGDSYGLANPRNVSEKYHEQASLLFDWYESTIRKIGPVDAVFCPGELTEGPGHKSTIELWTSDMEEQAEACAELLGMWDTPEYVCCYSSAYHSGNDLRTDHLVIDKIKLLYNRKAEIGTFQRRVIHGVRINMFHVVGGGSTPESFARALMKSVATDVVRGAYRGYESADIYIRGHSHVHGEVKNRRWASVNAPALKWPGGAYGTRIDRPYYSMGLLELTVEEDGSWDLIDHAFDYENPEENYREIVGRDEGKDKRRSKSKT